MSGLRRPHEPEPVLADVPPGPDVSPAAARAALSGTASARLIRRRERRGRVLLIGVDLVALLLGVTAGRVAQPGAPTLLAPAVVVAWLVALAWRGGYDRHRVGPGTSELSQVVDASVLSTTEPVTYRVVVPYP